MAPRRPAITAAFAWQETTLKAGGSNLRKVMLVAALLASPLAASAEPGPPVPRNAEGRFEYQETITAEGASAVELLSRAKAWIATAYRDIPSVLDLDDPAAGRLIVKGNYAASGRLAWFTIWHVLTIEAKDGRWRYMLTDFEVDQGGLRRPMEGDGGKYLYKRGWESVATGARNLVESLKVAMLNPPPGSDW